MPITRQVVAAGKKATSSSYKSISQVTGTDRKTDGTVILAMTKNFDSNLSGSHTNVESEITDMTLIG